MAIDWTKFDGYNEDMTAEEKLALIESSEPKIEQHTSSETKNSNQSDPADALESADPAEPLKTATQKKQTAPIGYVPKSALDAAASEAAKFKRQVRELMSADERKQAEIADKQEEMERELLRLQKNEKTSYFKASALGAGFDEAQSNDIAQAMIDGDMDAVFGYVRSLTTNVEKTVRAKVLKETPVPPAGSDPTGAEKAAKAEAALRKAMGL